MKKISIYLFLAVYAYPAMANAEDTMLKNGSKSIGFSINSGIELRGSYFFSDNWSWLVGLGYEQSTRENNFDASTNYRDSNDKIKLFTFSTGPKYYFYKNDINLFTEGLIEFDYGKTSSQYYDRFNETESYYSGEGTMKGIGIRLNLGAEYFIANQISLSGIVGLRYYDNESNTDYTNDQGPSTSTSSSSGFSTVQGALQVNFYF